MRAIFGGRMGKEEDDVKIGDLVWAKVSGYPWWPATVSRNVKQKMWKKGGKIWVNFFNDSQSAWIPVKNNLLPFNTINTTTVMEKIKPTHRSYDMIKEAIEEAAEVQKKQADEAMEVTVADPDDILAIAEGRVATKRGAEEKEEDGPAAKKPKKSLRGDAVDKEEPKKPRRRSTKAKVQAEEAATESSEDEIMEEVEKSTPKKTVKIKPSNDDKVQRLEKQVSTLKNEMKRLKEELKLSRSTRRNEYSAYVPPAPPMTEFSISTNPCSLPVTKNELSEELKLLKQYGHAYAEKSDAAAEHRKVRKSFKLPASPELSRRSLRRSGKPCHWSSPGELKTSVSFPDAVLLWFFGERPQASWRQNSTRGYGR
uniref:PWWP domain-containing protein n=1 Tax=Rhodosorus marinus TaxID=101924 RepID=A0A7S3E6K4_9RHOD|mmetsp:Transcript_13297/g.53055  ORF Transcript_13297/g.53055 Transcript_13297/m.53055 type:complete len:368 (+) Transcript_13297:331-1434(+)